MMSTLKSLILFSSAGLITVVVLAAPSWGNAVPENNARLGVTLDRAMRAAFYGLEADELVVRGHAFHVSKARFARSGSLTVMQGELEYRSPAGSPIVLHYTIRKRGNVLLSSEIRTHHDPSTQWSGRLARSLVGVSLADEQLDSVSDRLARIAGNNWREAAGLIVASIATRADQFGRDRLAMFRAQSAPATSRISVHYGRSNAPVKIPRADRPSRGVR